MHHAHQTQRDQVVQLWNLSCTATAWRARWLPRRHENCAEKSRLSIDFEVGFRLPILGVASRNVVLVLASDARYYGWRQKSLSTSTTVLGTRACVLRL